jgi:hypothetical protein
MYIFAERQLLVAHGLPRVLRETCGFLPIPERKPAGPRKDRVALRYKQRIITTARKQCHSIRSSTGAPTPHPNIFAAEAWLDETSRYPELPTITNSSPGPHSA